MSQQSQQSKDGKSKFSSFLSAVNESTQSVLAQLPEIETKTGRVIGGFSMLTHTDTHAERVAKGVLAKIDESRAKKSADQTDEQ